MQIILFISSLLVFVQVMKTESFVLHNIKKSTQNASIWQIWQILQNLLFAIVYRLYCLLRILRLEYRASGNRNIDSRPSA